MKGTPEEIFRELPDFDTIIKLTDDIASLLKRKLEIETRLRKGEADTFLRVSTDDKFLQNGKPPANTFIENTFKHTGIDGELLPFRLELAEVTSELEKFRLLYDTYKTMIDVWRTVSSNQRASVT